MGKKQPEDSINDNISDLTIGASFAHSGIIDFSAMVDYKKSTFKFKHGNSYFIKLADNTFSIIRVLQDGSIKYIIYDDHNIQTGEL